MTDKSDYLDDEDVISLAEKQSFMIIDNWTFMPGEFSQKMENSLVTSYHQAVKEWFENTIECKVLKPGAKWQKGKVRIAIKLEFTPDEEEEVPEETETPTEATTRPSSGANQETTALDEIRRQLTQN
ncbi:MAG TPA: hypothetical protein IGS52_10690 [Oscillatoriaceae cyanobacterium M33_DOE_052]|uniref:KGK domain-containing protein n=1 Tax=Planktothricoides sp. SpSt-374 TaxID=2282167 RepID=A0A7C3VW61_9CYAN|nr:hypothetical protein [Oscillatoriaceae cyanobacterium M33_DOE_052]